MPKGNVGWLNLPHSSTLPPPLTQSDQIPGDEHEQEIDGYGGKHFVLSFLMRVENAMRNVNNRSRIRAWQRRLSTFCDGVHFVLLAKDE